MSIFRTYLWTPSLTAAFTALVATAGCGSDKDSNSGGSYGLTAKDPASAEVASVDRFQDSFATLWKRSAPGYNPGVFKSRIPAANAPFALDTFIVHGLGPDGAKFTYYSLDIVPPVPQTAYQIVGSDQKPVPNQLPIFSSVPGDQGYTDFAQITTVEVNSSYVANSITSVADVEKAVAAGAKKTPTKMVNNWAHVPKDTTAALKYQDASPLGHTGWVNGKVVYYAQFETDVPVGDDGKMPAIDLFVTFKNDMDAGEGFATEADGIQTHNVMELLPGQDGYTSYWTHFVEKLADFDTVKDLTTARATNPAEKPIVVNCPVVQ